MPISDNISVLDAKKDVAIGIDLPLMDDYGSRFKQNYVTLDQASANARNLILTRPGERIMLPNFGCNLYGMLFENISDDMINEFKLRVKQQFEYWLPYIFINNLEASATSKFEIVASLDKDLNTVYTKQNKTNTERDYAKNTLYVHMIISLKNNKFDTKSISLELTNNMT